MTDKQAYLAAKYMSGPKADAILSKVGKKKKRKAPAANAPTPSGGVVVHDALACIDGLLRYNQSNQVRTSSAFDRII